MPKYELPDKDVSLVWSERREPLSPVRCRKAVCSWQVDEWINYAGNLFSPSKGDWLPWTPPVFPEREKLWLRRCWFTAGFSTGSQRIRGDYETGKNAFYGRQGVRIAPSVPVYDIDWIDPEFIDELPPDPRGSNA